MDTKSIINAVSTNNNMAIAEENGTMNTKTIYNRITVTNMEQYIRAFEEGHTCNSIAARGIDNKDRYCYALLHKDDSDRHMMLYAHCLMNECAEQAVTRQSSYTLHNMGYSIISQLADSAFGEALYWMGVYHLLGVHVPSDKNKAIEYLTRSSEAGFADASISLARHYDNGDGVAQDKEKAMQLLQQAAEQGADDALLAMSYSAISDDKLLELLQLAVAHGHQESREVLARMYTKGDIVEKDVSKAIALYQCNVDDGNISQLHRIADIYMSSDSQSDKLKAMDAYRYMADRGNVTALCKLANCYMNGYIVTKDVAKALNYYDLAGVKSSEVAVHNLLEVYTDMCGTDTKSEYFNASISDFMKYSPSFISGK